MNRYLALVVLMLGCFEHEAVPLDQHRLRLSNYTITALAVDSEGRLVALADSIERGPASLVVRMDRFGQPDPTFGNAGIAVLGNVFETTALAIVDGAIRIAVARNRGDVHEPAIIGLDRDGARDGFTIRLGDVPELADVQLFAQDDMLVANASPDDVGQLARYRPDGSRDDSFAAAAGKVNVPLTGGKILRVRRGFDLDPRDGDGAVIERLERDGALDPTFGGIVIVNFGDAVIDVDVAPGDTQLPVVLVGGGAGHIFGYRMVDEVTPDPSFGTGGIRGHTFDGVAIATVANTSDGGALLFGSAGDTARGAVIRLRADGEVDNTFGVNGLQILDDGVFTAVATLPDGTVVATSLHGASEPRITHFE